MNQRLHKRELTFNATVEELKSLTSACADLHDSNPRDLQLGEITLSNVIVLEVQGGTRTSYDARAGVPDTIQTSVRYYIIPKEA